MEQHQPNRLDLATLDQLRHRGADLSQPRHVIYYLFFPDTTRASAAATALAAAGLDAGVREPERGSETMVVADETAVVDEAAIGERRALLDGIAAQFGGDFDGWEAAIA